MAAVYPGFHLFWNQDSPHIRANPRNPCRTGNRYAAWRSWPRVAPSGQDRLIDPEQNLQETIESFQTEILKHQKKIPVVLKQVASLNRAIKLLDEAEKEQEEKENGYFSCN